MLNISTHKEVKSCPVQCATWDLQYSSRWLETNTFIYPIWIVPRIIQIMIVNLTYFFNSKSQFVLKSRIPFSFVWNRSVDHIVSLRILYITNTNTAPLRHRKGICTSTTAVMRERLRFRLWVWIFYSVARLYLRSRTPVALITSWISVLLTLYLHLLSFW